MRTIHTDEMIRSIRDMCIEANLTLSEDMKCRLKNAKETEKTRLESRFYPSSMKI